ncbi:hypothetical protein L596_029791 [Steinernema carpocapsae]|uniref:Uncharacterized protein n=1 Tax=Steinernema carpocapsae TaxID=34508 RepID=A0A4U5LQT8_STECR|nr:hypothetical protein L596_029791 [Steinernema carpocapsae]
MILENFVFDSHAKWMRKEKAVLDVCAALTKKIMETKLNVDTMNALTETDPNNAHVSTQTKATLDVTVNLSSSRIDCSESAELVQKKHSFCKRWTNANCDSSTTLEY